MEIVLSIIDALIKAGAPITAYVPEAMPNIKAQLEERIHYARNQYQVLERQRL